MVLLAIVLCNQIFWICSPGAGYVRTVMTVTGSAMWYELYVAYYGVVDLVYATPIVL